MKAFRVSVNGEQHCTAGIEGDCVTSVVVNWIASSKGEDGEFHTHIGGLDSTRGVHVRWPKLEIGVGDTIMIDVLETDRADPHESERSERSSGRSRWLGYWWPSALIAVLTAVAAFYQQQSGGSVAGAAAIVAIGFLPLILRHRSWLPLLRRW